jgi:uncharacterized protein YcbX
MSVFKSFSASAKPHLARIAIYPIKSLDPVFVDAARVLPSGALEFDRQWALVDASGKFINGKRTPLVHRLRAGFDGHFEQVTFDFDGRSSSFSISNDREAMEGWLSGIFSQPVRVLENAFGGFPDDTESPGPTVISTATLEAVAEWFSPMSVDETRRRFRANLEFGDVPAFWEDRLFGPAGSEVTFCVGGVSFAGTNPCQRCVVPTRHWQSGEVWPHFTPTFTRQRAANLPPWANRSRFNHFYRLAINTHLVGQGGIVQVGDAVVPS